MQQKHTRGQHLFKAIQCSNKLSSNSTALGSTQLAVIDPRNIFPLSLKLSLCVLGYEKSQSFHALAVNLIYCIQGVPQLHVFHYTTDPIAAIFDLHCVAYVQASVQPKPGSCIGNQNQDQVSVSVSGPELFLPKPKLSSIFSSLIYFSL